ncbi:hypothetical protein JTB14_037857 [Gonioctena quinquepunctata]|nr:hypothetical protein JTB14_037857 [Gonioctena quinquepunctata]
MSVKKEDKFGIAQFHGDNFSTWKFRVEVILQEYGVFECLTKDPPADEAARKNFDQQDNKAKSIIIQCVADSHLEYKRHNANMSEDCQDRDDERQKFPDDAEGVAFMVNNSSSSSKYNELSRMIWYVDSGASDHLTNDIKVLEDVKELEKPIKIGVAKAGEDLEGTHVGSIRVSNNVDGRIHKYTLLDVIYVPNLRKNLLSAGKIEEKGFRVDFHKHQIFIMKGCLVDEVRTSRRIQHSFEALIGSQL